LAGILPAMTRIAHISDSHLSGTRSYFFGNFEILREELAVLKPELVINTGDLTIDGFDSEDDLRFALACHERLGLPFRVIPGNHDVGEEPGADHLDQPTTAASSAQYRKIFGPEWWQEDIPGWRLFGLNSQIFGTGLPEELAQWAWLRASGEEANGNGAAIALFIHKPLWRERRDEPADPMWHVAPQHRERLLDALGPNLKLVCSGHLHQAWVREFSGVTHVWGPSCGFPSSEAKGQGAMPAVGYVLLDLAEDSSFEVDVRQPTVFVQHDYKAVKAGARFLKEGPLQPAPIPW
jgi:3',5'-cyclic AMP phosphodiesterase CpdA